MALGQAVLGDAYVNIMGETSQLQASFAKAEMMTKGLVSNLGKTIAVGMAASLAGIGGFLVYGLKQWMGKEVVIQDMAAALRLSGDNAKSSADNLVEFSNAIQRTTTLANEDVLALMKQGLALGIGSSKIKDFTKAAIGLGERLGMGPRTGVMMLNRAMAGNTAMLSRYGLQIDKTKSKSDQLKQVMKFAAEGFVLAEQKANTITGRLKQLRNAFGDFAAEFGKRIANQMGLKYFAEEAARVFDKVGGALGSLFGKERGKNEFASQIERFGKTLERILIHFTAFILTLPTVFRALYNIFSQPGKLLDLIVESGRSFAKFIWEAIQSIAAYLTELFKGLGPILSTSIQEALRVIPGIGKNMMEETLRERAKTSSLADMEGALASRGLLDKTMQRFSARSRSAYPDLTDQEFNKIEVTAERNRAARIQAAWQKMVMGDMESGRFYKEQRDAQVQSMRYNMEGPTRDLTLALEDGVSRFTDKLGAAADESGLTANVNAITSTYKGWLANLGKAAAGASGDLKGKGRDRGGAEKVGMETMSFAGFWSKMMKDAMTPKTDEEIAKATQMTADNTGKIYSELNRFNAGVFT